jgi:MHS family proline/betaine transporter-like MFS transporter
MSLSTLDFSKKERRTVIFAVTLGNLLEWYEIYLYIYWTPIIAKLFFNSESDLVNMTNTFLVFAMGFLARPFGGLFFGRLGDRIGRKKSLILSILMMTIPTFVTGFLPTHAQIGWVAPILLGLMRILQSFPAGGELPGAFCYLYESAQKNNQRFMCSWGAFGFQVGILLSTVECFFLEKFLPTEDLINWGWRLSFLVGGVIGLFGLLLRYKLHETPVYKEMLMHERVVKEPLLGVLSKHKKGILMGILFCALNSSTFYFLTVNFSVYFNELLHESYSSSLVIAAFLLILITVPLPYFGKLADRFDNRKMLVYSTLAIIALLYPLYLSITYSSLLFMGITIFIFSFFFTVLSTLIPFLLPNLFPTHVRFTCVGVSFNLADAIIGGFTPVIAMYLTHFTGKQGAFCWYILLCSLLSLGAYLMLPSKKSSLL